MKAKSRHFSVLAGRTWWENTLKPELALISKFHPDFYSDDPFAENCTGEELQKQWQQVKSGVYKEFSSLTQKNSLGVDCSGFLYLCYSLDKELEMDASPLKDEGNKGQLAEFRSAQTQGQAYVHKDFNLITKGDFIQKKGHVMIATGEVVRDEHTHKIIMYRTAEANSTAVGSVNYWRKVSDNKDDFTIGHPFRTADHGGLVYLFSSPGFKGFPIISQTPSPNALTRTTDNVQQTERSEADAKKELQASEK